MAADDPVAEALERCRRLPVAAVEKLFERYGRPVDDEAPRLDPSVLLDDGATCVGRLRFASAVDVIANDYFVLARDDRAPSAMPGPLFAAAIAALARAGE